MNKKKTLKGTVLFTTVSVMSLLILFLMGTLMLATASNGRAHKTYSSSQASYTARAAIDGFITAMERQPEVAIAVQQLGTASGPIYPKVTIGDSSSLGRIVRYEDDGTEVLDEIVVENTGEKQYVFFDNKATGSTGAQWHESDVVKITATARVGNEIETVSAYINKAPAQYSESTPSGPQVKGLQAIGNTITTNGSHIYGGYGVELDAPLNALPKYWLNNDANIDTTMTFINANFVNATSTFQVNVKKPADGVAPYAQTVVAGNMSVKNNTMVVLDYQPNSSWTNSEIPYFYVNGAVVLQSQPDALVRDVNSGDPSKRGAYNFICGTLCTKDAYGNLNHCGFESTNLYLMDEYKPSEKYVVDNEFGTQEVVKGDNIWGGTAGSKLNEWSESLFERTDWHSTGSHGGNIYCNGNLTLKGVTIEGDVRVKGDCKIVGDENTVIKGDLIVGGTLTLDFDTPQKAKEKFYNHLGGQVFASNGSAPSDVVPIDRPRIQVENVSSSTQTKDISDYTNLDKIDTSGDQFRVYCLRWDTDAHMNGADRVDPCNNVYPPEVSGVVYYRLKNDVSYNQVVKSDMFDLNFEVSGDSTVDELMLDENSLFVKYIDSFNFDNWITADEAAGDLNYVYDSEIDTIYYIGKPVSVGTSENHEFLPSVGEFATEDYFYHPSDNRVMTQAEIDEEIMKLEDAPMLEEGPYILRDYETNEIIDDAYPYKTVYWYQIDEIWYYTEDESQIMPLGYTGDTSNKILPLSLSGLEVDAIYPPDMRREVIYGKPDYIEKNGEIEYAMVSEKEECRFIYNVMDARESLGLDREFGKPDSESYPTDDALNTMINKAKMDVDDVDYDGSGTINQKYCEISGTIREDITIEGTDDNDGTVVILLDNCTIEQGKIIFKQNNATQKVQFILKGDVKLNLRSAIMPYTINNPIKYSDDFGMNYFGFENSMLTLDNNSLAFGSFRAPYTKLVAKMPGNLDVNYQPESWKTGDPYVTGKPNIVGNGIFSEVDVDNTFALYYTQAGLSGGSGGGVTSINTACGKFIVGYYGAS